MLIQLASHNFFERKFMIISIWTDAFICKGCDIFFLSERLLVYGNLALANLNF